MESLCCFYLSQFCCNVSDHTILKKLVTNWVRELGLIDLMIVQFHGLVYSQDENILLDSQGFLDPIAAYCNHSNWQDVDHVHVHGCIYTGSRHRKCVYTLYYVILHVQ